MTARAVGSSSTNSAIVCLPNPRAIPTTAWMTAWSVGSLMQLRTNSPSILMYWTGEVFEVVGEVFEVVEGAKSGAEVVERERAPELGESLAEPAGLGEVQPLGDRQERGRVFRCETCDDRGDAR
jgi:hypothetical protein